VDAATGLAKLWLGRGTIRGRIRWIDNFLQNNFKQSQIIGTFRAAYIGGK
jgi:hypothetical protein